MISIKLVIGPTHGKCFLIRIPSSDPGPGSIRILISIVQHFDLVKFVSLNFFQFLNLFLKVVFTVRTIQSKVLHFSFENFAIAKYIGKEKRCFKT